jgi:2-amino-4-hydroxy-6-hydroxymethyldihydropteridine diphosphokinase
MLGKPIVQALIGLGSNLGDRMEHMERALALLEGPQVLLRRVSSVYESAPLGPVQDQPPFYNAAAEVETTLGAMELLRHCQAIEAALGRERLIAKGPRTIDLDLLLIGDRLFDEPSLTVPHPELTCRAFALIPLLELAPMSVDPRDGVLLCRYAEPLLRAQALVRLGSVPGYPSRARLPAKHYPTVPAGDEAGAVANRAA